ncbi:hypothetical protein Poli38472_011882 [Pythium oligandrum]|uniref:Trichohyalin-plectin-homology domain-containing protein n=1 Tax=Pythium oligandrum TaxID=41045 RepID=A0A8K1C8A1_PYTOL|nr:hypothetical protein Poli38472_011882 [Pythium oligandrum]|eukprot:TMW58294.1 hypothetical protein Poli38472_011882 [Pythium oligandrum]
MAQRVASSKRKTSSDGRTMAASILIREERRSDKRQVLAEALVAKLTSKYAKNDAAFAESINTMTQRLVLHTQRRVAESDIVALEAVIKKMAQEREQRRRSGPNVSQTQMSQGGKPSQTAPAGSNPHSGSGSPGRYGNITTSKPASALPRELQGQDEWVLLNALTLVEYESEKDREKQKQLEKQRQQRAWLDAQHAEKQALKSREKQQQHVAFEREVADLGKWQEAESAKKLRQQEQILKVRLERDEQLRQQKLRQEQQSEQRRCEDQAEVERIQRELRQLEETAHARRHQEHERVRKLQAENQREQQAKNNLKEQEQEDDVKLMEAYARRLAREDEARMYALQGRFRKKRGDALESVASIHEQQRKKALEDERRAEEYQRKKNEEAMRREHEEQERRRREALERKQFLELQRRQKHDRELKEVEEDLVYAQHVVSDSRKASEEQKKRAIDVRRHNMQLQEKLIEQIHEQKAGQPISPLHLPRTLMNSREKNINAKLLQKLEEPELTHKVLQKLSPSKDPKAITISTSFY